MSIGPSKVPGEKAGPHGSFPIGDKKHARLAIGGATRSERAGNISKSEEEHIKAKARAKLGGKETDSKRKKLRHTMSRMKGGKRDDNEEREEAGAESKEHIMPMMRRR